jgi:hypothetical protein
MTCYLHHVPGRLRIRSSAVKNNKARCAEVERLLHSVAGVEKVVVNLTTGSCLIGYDPSITTREHLISLLTSKGYFDQSRAITNDEYFQNMASKVFSLVASFI